MIICNFRCCASTTDGDASGGGGHTTCCDATAAWCETVAAAVVLQGAFVVNIGDLFELVSSRLSHNPHMAAAAAVDIAAAFFCLLC